MYKVISNGEVIATVENIIYVKMVHGIGGYVKTTKENAQGVVCGGKAYNLLGRETMEEGLPIVNLRNIDGAKVVESQVSALEGRMEEVFCDMDISIEDIKEALCDIDEQLNGGNENE